MARRAFLFGYYGFGNLGDELLCRHYAEVLREALPAWERIVVTADPHHEGGDGKESRINRWNMGQWYRSTRPGDIWVVGGGTLLQNATSHRSLAFYLMVLALAHRRGASILLFGQGLEPLHGRLSKIAVKKILNIASILEVRDEDSYTMANNFRRASTHLGTDPLWGLDFPCRPIHGDGVLLILKAADIAYVPDILDMVKEFRPILRVAAFQASDVEPLQQITGHRVEKIANSTDLLSMIEGIDFVISSRMHGVLLSALLRFPVIGWSSDPKVKACCDSLGFQCISPEVREERLGLVNFLMGKTRVHQESLLEERVQTLRGRARASREWTIQTLRRHE